MGLILTNYSTYYIQFIMCASACIRFFLCTFPYALPFRPRKHIPLRLLLAVLLFGIYVTGITALRSAFDIMGVRVLCRFFNYLVVLPLLFLFYEEDVAQILLCWCAGTATEEFSVHLFYLLLNLAGVDDRTSISFWGTYASALDWTFYILFHVVAAVGCFLVFGRGRYLKQDSVALNRIALLSAVSTLSLGLLSSITRDVQEESRTLYLVVLCFCLLFSLFVLVLRTGILSENKYRQELSLMEELLHQEKKQYEHSKENIDLINMKCHDLKHLLSDLEGKLTAAEIHALQDAVNIYDHTIQTGNETLDMILYEKQLACQKDSISLSCMADGAALSFLSLSHTYSLFNNAIDNAIEAVRQIPDPEKRIIGITVRREGVQVVINVTNYFEGIAPPADGLSTTKTDKNHHGFGLRSMRYVAGLYQGTVSTSAEHHMFSLDIRLPVPAGKQP